MGDLMLAREQPFTLRGPMLSLYDLPFQRVGGERVTEVLIDSAAGTGKSLGIASTLLEWMRDFPNSRILVVRQTMRSLRESWQVTFEEHVLPAWGLTPGRGSRSHRTKYSFFGSELVLGGMDNPDKLFSTEWNVVVFVEGNQINLDSYMKMFRSLRWPHGAPFHILLTECNPDSPFHHLFDRFCIGHKEDIAPGRVRWQASHKDNPHLWDDETLEWTEAGDAYMETLGRMSGVVRRRLLHGEWAAAEGQVFDNFDPAKHVISARREYDESSRSWSLVLDEDGTRVKIGWFAAGQDWGFENPGVFQVWGMGDDERWYLVEEVYQSKRDHQWWAEQIERLHEKYGIWRAVSDPEEAEGISVVQRRVRAMDGKALLIKANKSSAARGRTGFAQAMHMRALIEEDRLRWLVDARQHPPDQELMGRPRASHEEVPALMWAPPPASRQYEHVGGAPPTDVVLKTNDHGYDATRYLMWAVYQRDLTPPPVQTGYAAGTWGDILKLNTRK